MDNPFFPLCAQTTTGIHRGRLQKRRTMAVTIMMTRATLTATQPQPGSNCVVSIGYCSMVTKLRSFRNRNPLCRPLRQAQVRVLLVGEKTATTNEPDNDDESATAPNSSNTDTATLIPSDASNLLRHHLCSSGMGTATPCFGRVVR
jgi:hypothetical protein